MQNDDESLLEKIREGDVLVVNLAPERLTPELSMQCVRINGSNLRFIPRAVRTPAFDRAAALCSAWAFGYLDEADKTEELLLAVLASDDADTDPACSASAGPCPTPSSRRPSSRPPRRRWAR